MPGEAEHAKSPLSDASSAPSKSLAPPRGLVSSRPLLPMAAHKSVAPWERWFLACLAVLWGTLMLSMLARVPRPFVDDSWSQAMAAYTIAFEGWPRNPGLTDRGGVDQYLLEPRLFPSLVGAGVYRLVGFSLARGRLIAVLFSGVFLFAVYRMMRRLFGAECAAAITVMTMVDPWVFITGRTYRAEVFLAALVWSSWLLLLTSLDHRSLWRAFLGGVLIGLACWTHPNAAAYSAAALVGIAAVAGLRRLWELWIPTALVGVLIGLAPYLLYVAYVQEVTDLRLLDQVGFRTGAYARPFWESRPFWDIVTTEGLRWSNFLQLPLRMPLSILFLGALAYAALRGSKPDRFLLILIVLASPMIALINTHATGRYLVVLTPALAALVWRALPAKLWGTGGEHAGGGAGSRRRRLRRAATLGILLVYASMTVVPTLSIFWGHRRADYDAWMARVTKDIPPDATIMAHTMYWTGLHNRQFLSTDLPFGSSIEDAVEHLKRYRPEYIIQSSHKFGALKGIGPRPKDVRVTDFAQACERVAQEVPYETLAEFYHRDFGAVRVWRFQWPADPSVTP